MLWQTAVKQAETGARDAREQTDADIEQADLERDTAQARAAELETELAVLREVQTERDRLLEDVRQLRAEAQPLREQVARLTATGEYLAAQLQDTKGELNAFPHGCCDLAPLISRSLSWYSKPSGTWVESLTGLIMQV